MLTFCIVIPVFLCPRMDRSGAYIVFGLSVCFSTELLHWPYLLIGKRAFIFHMSIPFDKTFQLVTSSLSSAWSRSIFKISFIKQKEKEKKNTGQVF